MSHTTTIADIVFNDIDALRGAIKELQSQGVRCSLKENCKPRAFYANQEGMGIAPYVLELQDARYDIGFYQDDSVKGLVARTDLFAGSVAGVLGVKAKSGVDANASAMGKLRQLYAVHAATRQAVKQGYNVSRRLKDDGTVALVVTGYK